jgi:precorrin-8X/cobalt-precorrin-8 methylmutase
VDDEQNGNNRFAVAAQLNARCGGNTFGPFWGCPAGQAQPSLEMTSPRGGYPYLARHGLSLESLRCTDKVERGVQSVWKLSGNGSVGGQTLVGIPAVLGLRNDPRLSSFSRIWPFETGFSREQITLQGPAIVYAEIWPGLLATQLDLTLPVRDQAQVRAVVQWLARFDAAGTLGALFAAPPGLSDSALGTCLAEEGWTLGVGHAGLT